MGTPARGQIVKENPGLPDSPPAFLRNGPADAGLTFAFAHGAGAPMDTPFMTAFAEGLAERGWRVVRFEFPYMSKRRDDGKRRPPDRAPVLLTCWQAVIDALGPEALVIGGKSMGGRMASMVAADAGVRGLACLGYPFHPPGKPDRLRVGHLAGLTLPSLILQGSRDPLGNREEVADYPLSPSIAVHWAEDGDHDLKPRKASGRSREQNWNEAIAALDAFLRQLA